jgi:hypothetical protein
MMRNVRVWTPMIAFLFALGMVACGDDDDNNPTCGDGNQEGSEVCDGSDLNGATCATQVSGSTGTLACNATCTGYVTTGCHTTGNCGNGTVDTGEECDGTNLDGETCLTLGHDGGTLTCAACSFVETACTDEDCDTMTISDDATPTCEGGSPIDSDTYDDWYYYQPVMVTGETNPFVIFVQLYGDWAQDSSGIVTGTITLGEGDALANWDDCAYCITALQCANSTCATSGSDVYYWATAGTLTITTLGQPPSGHLVGSLSGVTWTEMDSDDLPDPDGMCWELASYTFDATVDYPE